VERKGISILKRSKWEECNLFRSSEVSHGVVNCMNAQSQGWRGLK